MFVIFESELKRKNEWKNFINKIFGKDLSVTGSGTGDMISADSQSITGLKTFDKDKLAMKGTSSGKTIISTANTSSTNYTITLPAKSITIADNADIPDVTNLAPKNNPIFTGTVTLPAFSGRKNPRVQTVTSASNVTPSADNDDVVDITAQAASLTIANPTGTPVSKQMLMIDIVDNGTARALSFGTNYAAGGTALPTTTVLGLQMSMVFVYTNSKWKLRSLAQD